MMDELKESSELEGIARAFERRVQQEVHSAFVLQHRDGISVRPHPDRDGAYTATVGAYFYASLGWGRWASTEDLAVEIDDTIADLRRFMVLQPELSKLGEATVVDQSKPQVSFTANGHTFAVGTKVELVGHGLTGRIIATHRGTIVVGLVHGPVMQLQPEHFKLLDVRPL